MTQAARPASHAIEDAADVLRPARSVAVVSHVDPDADAIGSVLGLAGGLRALGKDVVAALSDPIPEYARFLPGAAGVVSALPDTRFDVYLFADAADLERIGTIFSSDRERFVGVPLIELGPNSSAHFASATASPDESAASGEPADIAVRITWNPAKLAG